MTPTGEPEFNAPEMLKSEKLGVYDERVDIWGLGVCLYMMLSGGMNPFFNENIPKMVENITSELFQIMPPTII